MKNKTEQDIMVAQDQYRYASVRTVVHTSVPSRLEISARAMQGLLGNADWTRAAKISDDWDEYKQRVCSAAIDLCDELIRQEAEASQKQ